jgi:hypothetical protein
MQALSPVFDDFVEFLTVHLSKDEILGYTASEEAQERASELLERNSAGDLSPDEQEELQEMMRVDGIVSLLKARALAASRK